MHLTITNLTLDPEAIGTPDGNFVDVLQPSAPYEYTQDATVLLLGDKPTVREQFETAGQRLAELARKVLTVIAGRKREATEAGTPEVVNVSLQNHGANAVRAILGDGQTEQTVNSGETASLSAVGYIELRELGLVQQDPNQHEAA